MTRTARPPTLSGSSEQEGDPAAPAIGPRNAAEREKRRLHDRGLRDRAGPPLEVIDCHPDVAPAIAPWRAERRQEK
eukprot:3719463-Alexandrium_andersonii.AAC.1